MKLVSLTVENFRSITSARKIPISQMTTLIGPNNEGKSNILRALAIAMTSLLRHRPGPGAPARRKPVVPPRLRRRPRNYHQYNWQSDYPLHLQDRNSRKKSNIILEFELTQPEIEAFREKIGSRLNGTLPIAFSFDREGQYLSIAKQGRGHKVLNSKASAIADFVAARLDVLYIPAVRTAEAAQAIVDELVAEELSKIEDDPRYVRALEDITTLQQPVLDALASSIADTMRIFLPQISNVKLSIESQDRVLPCVLFQRFLSTTESRHN
jgi:putative ATP-dependent endonuclease of the OLD family